MKTSVAFSVGVVSLALAVWVIAYMMGSPLSSQETFLVLGLSALALIGLGWTRRWLNERKSSKEDRFG